MFGSGLLLVTFSLSACGMMAGMMGMGDKWHAMLNMDEVMDEEGMNVQKIMAKRTEEEQKAFARGRDLFNDVSLGKNGQSCNSCHAGGGASSASAKVVATGMTRQIASLKGAAARYPKYDPASHSVITLKMRDNNCIRLYMDGSPLALDGWDSSSLEQYVKSFSNGSQVAAGSGR